MNFIYDKYLLFYLSAIFLFIIIVAINEKTYFAWIKKYWFFKRTKTSIMSQITYLASIALLGLSLLDLRGSVISSTANIVEQNTIILIDNSESMLVEDVTPNRFKRSVMLARHLVKNSIGHKIAIVLFSDIQKRIIPFTDDLDLLDSRLSALDELSIVGGGSNLKSAINESFSYFREMSDNLAEINGNLIVLSDFEFHDDNDRLHVPSGVNVAMLGIGTVRGGNIPNRSVGGILNDFKRYQGELVVSSLNERAIQEIGKNFKYFKYWIPLSEGVYSNEIWSFFRNIYREKLKKGTISSRPVLVNYLLVPAICLFAVSVLFSLFNTFKITTTLRTIALLVLFGLSTRIPLVIAEEKNRSDKAMNKMIARLNNGDLSNDEKLKLAEKFLRINETEKSITLYKENIKNLNDATKEVRFNLATAFLKSEKKHQGIMGYKLLISQLDENSVKDDKILSSIRQNILLMLNSKSQKKTDGNGGKKEESGPSQEQKDGNKGEGGGGEKSKEKKDKQGKEQNKKQEEKPKEKNKDGEKGDEESKKPPPPPTLQDFEKQIEQKRKMVKVPALLKQLLSDDRDIQKKYFQTKKQTLESKEKKDW